MTSQEKQITTFLKEQLQELDERILALEMKLSGVESGTHLIWQVLEEHGLVKNGEIVKKEPPPTAEKKWDSGKVKWEEKEGPKGLYEKSEDSNNLEFKNMLKDLANHGGKITRNGYFYWIFQSGNVVGRKKRGK